MTEYKAIAAMAANRIIGCDGKIPWHLPKDLRFFKRITAGHAIVMGRKTWESLGSPLPGRRNIIMSRTMPPVEGAEIVRSVKGLSALELTGSTYIIGGEEIYRLLLPWCSTIYLTVLHQSPEGDASFPSFEIDFPNMSLLESMPGVAEWRLYTRRKP